MTGLSLEGRRTTGVHFRRRGSACHAAAGAEVILAAGAIGSPKILELSGIGAAQVLTRHGIEVRHELPGVGENLQDHLQIRTVFRITGARTLNDLYASPVGRAKLAAEYALRRSGPMAMAPSQLGIFTRTGPEHETPNIEYHVNAWIASASHSTAFQPSPSPSATCGRTAAAACISQAPIPPRHLQSARTISAPKPTGVSPWTRSAMRAD